MINLIRFIIKNSFSHFFVTWIFFISCTSRSKYSIGPIDTNINTVQRSLNPRSVQYENLLEEGFFNNALDHGFLHPGDHRLNIDVNNQLESGLGYIFINTLRLKLDAIRPNHPNRIYFNSLNKWSNEIGVNTFICPKPWKYRVQNIRGIDYGVFYLESIQMGEYNNINDNIINNDNIIDQRRSPYVTVYDDNQVQRSILVEVDHLLKDNRYLIELPKRLHKFKTKVLDPSLCYHTQVDRSLFNANEYWRSRREHDQQLPNFNIETCFCGINFEYNEVDEFVQHVHEQNWGLLWNVRMRSQHLQVVE